MGIPQRHDGRARRRWRHLLAKRVLDVTLSLTGLVLMSPVMLVVAVAICCDTRGPALFNAVRVGRLGKPFLMYKFRTMVVDAEERLKELQSRNLGGVMLIRIPHDPRVTRVGRMLRMTSLDELPQLLNVLRGDMSLVGPRPQYPGEVAYYSDHQRRRLEATPGITGLWQVAARQSADFDEWVRLDLEYIRTFSFWLDLNIQCRTIPAALRHGGN